MWKKLVIYRQSPAELAQLLRQGPLEGLSLKGHISRREIRNKWAITRKSCFWCIFDLELCVGPHASHTLHAPAPTSPNDPPLSAHGGAMCPSYTLKPQFTLQGPPLPAPKQGSLPTNRQIGGLLAHVRRLFDIRGRMLGRRGWVVLGAEGSMAFDLGGGGLEGVWVWIWAKLDEFWVFCGGR